MNDLYIGNYKTGNFRVLADGSPDISKYILIRQDKKLFLCKKNEINANKYISVDPIDEEAFQIIEEFDENIGEDNSSIYRLSLNNNVLTVILYEYLGPKKLIGKNEHMYIYADRQLEKILIEDKKYSDIEFIDRKGYTKKIKTEDDVVEFLYNQFMNNRSIFVHEDRKNKDNPHRFQMFGKNFRVQVDMVRNGIYEISRIFKTQNTDYSFELYQIFGNIDFVTYVEQTKIKTAELSSENVISIANTSKIFKAWEQYMDFKEQLYHEELEASKIFKYNKIEVDRDKLTIIVNFDDDTDLTSEERKDIEYEFISKAKFPENMNFPESISELIEFKKKRESFYYICSCGKCKNDTFEDKKMIFDIPEYFTTEYCNSNGILYVSDASLRVEKRRREQVSKAINTRNNPTAKMILDLTDPNVKDIHRGKERTSMNDKMLRAMFGDKDVDEGNIKLSTNYMEALDIAVNTPDIALIQGPPGTGKTTLINGLVARLNSLNDNVKILVSAEQHDALENVLESMSDKNFPAFVSSTRKNSDFDVEVNMRQEKNIASLQKNIIELCDEILKNESNANDYSVSMKKLALLVRDVREANYGVNIIREKYDELKDIILSLGYYTELNVLFSSLTSALFQNDVNNGTLPFELKILYSKIRGQRLDYEAFISDDGVIQLEDLQEKLKKYGYIDNLINENIYSALISSNEEEIKKVFDEYIDYVEKLEERIIPKANPIKKINYNFKDLFESLYCKILELSRNHNNSFIDIVQDLKYKASDYDNIKALIQNYTDIIGSTCAQAAKSTNYMENSQKGRFNYVIIDEAARANPLDLMIPLMMGISVIMVGDHKQLPHYIETDIKRKFESDASKYEKNFDKDLLTKSLFEVIYENLDKAYLDGRLAFRRTIKIDEQHRMNPIIGEFISNEFYDGEIKNGPRTDKQVNDYSIFGGKNLVFINVSKENGYEEPEHSSYYRDKEVEKIVSLVSDVVSKNPDRFTYNSSDKDKRIGILSFYNEQMNHIKEEFKKKFPEQTLSNIKFGTVDSFQGKQFDIVFLSCVRCNGHKEAEKALGFIQYSDSRINVALSRARKVLVVVGDSDTFSKNKHFNNYILKTKELGGYYDE